MTNGSLSHREYGLDLKQLSFSGHYANSSGSSLSLENVVASQAGQALRFDMQLDDFGDPLIDLQAEGRIALAALAPLLPGGLSEPEGFARLEQLTINGKVRDLQAGAGGSSSASGQATIRTGRMEWNGRPVRIPRGECRLDGDRVHFSNLEWEGAGIRGRVEGEVRNLLASLMLEGEDRPVPVAQTEFIATEFDLKTLLETASRKTNEEGDDDGDKGFRLPRLRGQISARIEAFIHRDIRFENLQAELDLDPGYIRVRNARAEGQEGELKLEGGLRQYASVNSSSRPGRLEGLDVAETFRQFRDFGQRSLTREHLRGKAYGRIESLTAAWDAELNLIEEEIEARFDVEIQDGELIGFEPVEALSRFIRIDELRHIRFSSLENSIRIENRRIHIPAMEVQSSALSLSLREATGSTM